MLLDKEMVRHSGFSRREFLRLVELFSFSMIFSSCSLLDSSEVEYDYLTRRDTAKEAMDAIWAALYNNTGVIVSHPETGGILGVHGNLPEAHFWFDENRSFHVVYINDANGCEAGFETVGAHVQVDSLLSNDKVERFGGVVYGRKVEIGIKGTKIRFDYDIPGVVEIVSTEGNEQIYQLNPFNSIKFNGLYLHNNGGSYPFENSYFVFPYTKISKLQTYIIGDSFNQRILNFTQ